MPKNIQFKPGKDENIVLKEPFVQCGISFLSITSTKAPGKKLLILIIVKKQGYTVEPMK